MNHSLPKVLQRSLFLGVLVVSLAAPAAAAPATASTGPQLKGRLGFESFGLREFSVERVIDTTVELGLDYVEIFNGHVGPATPPGRVAEVKKLLAAKRVKLSALFVGNATESIEENRRLFEFARQMETRVIIVNQIDERGIDGLNGLCAEFPDIRVCLHNHGPRSQGETLGQVEALLKRLHPNVGACIDTGHVMRSREDPVKWARALKGRIYGVHLKEYSGHRPLGPGIDLPLREFLRALADGNFPEYGALTVEFEGTPKDPFESVRVSVEYVRKLVGEINK